MMAAPVPAPSVPVLAERGGTQLKTPKPVLLVGTREQNPMDCSRFAGWFPGIEKRALVLGDYSIAGLETACVVEGKDLPALVHSLTADRSVFLARLRRMAGYPHRLLVISAALSQVKSPYPFSGADPSHILQSLIAVLAGTSVPFLCTETHSLAEEIVAAYLYQVHVYHWLEGNDFGPFLVDNDL
jgi:hypothetical protein